MKYISADELKKHWEILDFELLKYIRDGLPAYDRIGMCTITDSQVVYEKEESIDDLRTRLLLRESKHQSQRVEKNNSAEYAINAHRLIKAGLLDSKLPPPEVYDVEKVGQRVEKRIIEEYDQLPSFPVVPPGRRLISAELNDSDLHTLLDEIKTFQFKILEINQFAQLHELKLINEAEVPQVDATATQPSMNIESCDTEIGRRDMSSTQNDPNTFPLNFGRLKDHAQHWVTKFKNIPIEAITLYHYSNKIAEILGKSDRVKYCVVFEIKDDADANYSFLECYDTANRDRYSAFTVAGFEDVYHRKPGKHFKDEWKFTKRRLEEGTRFSGIWSEIPHWVLFDRNDMTKEPLQTQGVPANQSATPNSSTPDRAASTEHADPEAFIRSLQVFHVDNTTIKIQYKRKSTDYTCKSIGFRDSKTKAWMTFLEILQSKDHFYKLGPANYYDEGLRKKVPVKEYSRRKALLKEIKKKLLYFLSKQYGVVFPPRVKLYELQPTQGDGVYLFLFQIPLDKPSYKTKDQALRLLETLIQEEASNEKIQQASETAMDAGATQDEVFEIVKDRLISPQKYSETAGEPEDGDEDKEE